MTFFYKLFLVLCDFITTLYESVMFMSATNEQIKVIRPRTDLLIPNLSPFIWVNDKPIYRNTHDDNCVSVNIESDGNFYLCGRYEDFSSYDFEKLNDLISVGTFDDSPPSSEEINMRKNLGMMLIMPITH